MNNSPRINPESCRECGECCKNFMLWYPGGLPRPVYDEMIRIKYMKGVKVHFEPGDGGNWLVFDHPCEFLDGDEEHGYQCAIYDKPERPTICALFPYPDTTKDQCPHLIQSSTNQD